MNNNIKISLTVVLEGSVLVRKNENREVITYSLNERDLNPNKKWKGKDGLEVVKKGRRFHTPLVAKPATQHLNISVDSYKHMMSSEVPYWAKAKDWINSSPIQRLEAHLQRICEHFNGISYSYELLDD